jgi:hypothetical protein
LASDLGLVYLHVIAPDGIERDLPSVSDTLGNFGADTGSTKTEGSPGHTSHVEVLDELGGGRPARFENFVRSIDRTARPTLYYKHSLLPHVPFQYFPDGHRYRREPHDVIPGLIDVPSWGNEYLLQQAYQRHLLQAGFADRLLGTLLRRLHEKNLYDRALIVVTADNGESILHRGANRHLATPGTVEDIADTPAVHQAALRALRPDLGPARPDGGHPAHDFRRARDPDALADRRRVGLRPLRPNPVERRCLHALGPQAQALVAGVQAADTGVARPQDQPVRRAWRVAAPVRDRAPIRS